MTQPSPVSINGEYLFRLDQTSLWCAITDPEVLVSSIRACESVEKRTDTDYRIVVKFSLGIASPKFMIDVVLSDLQEPERYKMQAASSSRLMGDASGAADVVLQGEANSTRLTYDAEVTLTGALGKFSDSVVQAAAHKALNYFFAKLEKQLCGHGESD